VVVEMAALRKEFTPHIQIVPVGSTVRFPNQDPILHNVFSVSGRNSFDLGLSGKGPGAGVVFREAGIVRVFCNVHHGMFGYVFVVASPYWAKVAADGTFRIADVLRMRAAVVDWKDAVYRELQFGLRQAVGTRTLDTLLANKGELDEAILGHAAPRLATLGIELINAGVKDVILPGEMKTLLNQVVEAEKSAQANLIKRREETAATRNLLNTAKLLEDNPVLLRLKELETLEKVTEKIDRLTVFGGLEGVMKQLVSLK
jgi:hypothetical protein